MADFDIENSGLSQNKRPLSITIQSALVIVFLLGRKESKIRQVCISSKFT